MRQEARLLDDKLQKCELLLSQFNLPRKVSLRELQSLLGLFNFTCSVVVPGRAFLRRMIDLTRRTRRPHPLNQGNEMWHAGLALFLTKFQR